MSLQSSFILKDLPGTTRVSVAEVNFCDNCPAWGFLGRVHSVDTDPRATACGSTRSKEAFCLTQITRCRQESCSVSFHSLWIPQRAQIYARTSVTAAPLAGLAVCGMGRHPASPEPCWSQALVWKPTNSPSFCPSLSTPARPQH